MLEAVCACVCVSECEQRHGEMHKNITNCVRHHVACTINGKIKSEAGSHTHTVRMEFQKRKREAEERRKKMRKFHRNGCEM